MENEIFELQYALDTFYFVISGAFVMWMAAGFSMLEAGLVRAKNTTEILTKNVMLFAIIALCTMAQSSSPGFLKMVLQMSGHTLPLQTFSFR